MSLNKKKLMYYIKLFWFDIMKLRKNENIHIIVDFVIMKWINVEWINNE